MCQAVLQGLLSKQRGGLAAASKLMCCAPANEPKIIPKAFIHLASRGRFLISKLTRFGGSLLLRDMLSHGKQRNG
jgi:hypothetical protein